MERQACDSSCAASVGYDAERRVLEVEYRGGGVYRYLDVPPEEYRDLMRAESLGQHLNRAVKPNYRCEKA